MQVMKFVPALTPARDEPGRLQHAQVLRDRLPCEPELVLHRQPGAQLEQRLAVAVVELIENRPSRRGG